MTETDATTSIGAARELPDRDYAALPNEFDLFSQEHVAWRDDAFAYAREAVPIRFDIR